MGNIGLLPSERLLPAFGIDLHLHAKVLRKKTIETKIVIPLKIGDSNAPAIYFPKVFQNREVLPERERRLLRGPLETEEEFEKVTQDHEAVHPLPLEIHKPDERFHLPTFTSGEVGIGNKDPVPPLTRHSQSLPFPHRCNQTPSASSDRGHKHFAGR